MNIFTAISHVLENRENMREWKFDISTNRDKSVNLIIHYTPEGLVCKLVDGNNKPLSKTIRGFVDIKALNEFLEKRFRLFISLVGNEIFYLPTIYDLKNNENFDYSYVWELIV